MQSPSSPEDTRAEEAEHQNLLCLDDGRYLVLGRPASAIRSTICIAVSHDGNFFASTHGDHSVKVFRYPSGEQVACLEGHPRTPWTVQFHPTNSEIIASACLGGECRVWDVPTKRCVKLHKFEATVSCVSFHPNGSLLSAASGKAVYLWKCLGESGSSLGETSGEERPQEVLTKPNPLHLVEFHPSGNMIMTGEKNRLCADNSSRDQDAQFTLRVEVFQFEGKGSGRIGERVLTLPKVVAYNTAGVHFSPCGEMLGACIPTGAADGSSYQVVALSLKTRGDSRIGSVMYQMPLDEGHVGALTNINFSPRSKHLLLGYSFRPGSSVLREIQAQSASESQVVVPVVYIYTVNEQLEELKRLNTTLNDTGAAEDAINVAVFAPSVGLATGILCGTQSGRLRMFAPTSIHTASLPDS